MTGSLLELCTMLVISRIQSWAFSCGQMIHFCVKEEEELVSEAKTGNETLLLRWHGQLDVLTHMQDEVRIRLACFRAAASEAGLLSIEDDRKVDLASSNFSANCTGAQ